MAVLTPFDLIQRVEPQSGQSGVPVSTQVAVRFLRDMMPETITGATIRLFDDSGAPVPATVQYALRTATLTPLEPLKGGTRYRALVLSGPSGVMDILGNTLGVDFVWNFTTAKQELLPAPRLLWPQNGSRTAQMTPPFRWRAVPGAARYELEVARTPAFDVLYYRAEVLSVEGDEIEHVPSEVFESARDEASIYYWRVRAVGEDETPGLYSETWQFNNATYAEPGEFSPGFLEVMATSPLPNSYNQSAERIVLVFNEPLDPDSVEIVVEAEDV